MAVGQVGFHSSKLVRWAPCDPALSALGRALKALKANLWTIC